MRFPSWSEFIASVSNIEKEITEKVQEFKQNHPLLDKAIKSSISYLPPPFNGIAQQIYDTFEGDPENKSQAILNYFKYLQNQGEVHYNEITKRLDTILVKIDDLSLVAAKESTVQNMREILISFGTATDQKFDILVKDISQIDVKLDSLVLTVGRAMEVVDKLSVQMDAMVGNLPKPHSVMAVTEGNKIVLKRGDQAIETITAEDLNTKLDSQSKALIQSFEDSMQDQFNLWTKVYPKRNTSPDPIVNAQVQLRLKEIGKQMCSDWKQILQFLNQLNYSLADHYSHIGYLCNQLDSLV